MSNVFSRFENNVENAIDAAAGTVFKSPIEPAQIAKKAEKQMKTNRLVGAGRQYAPTLYNVLVSSVDDKRLFGFYPTMAAELETYLMAKGADAGLNFDGRPLVRFIVDEGLKKGKFDVIVENVAAPVIRKLREEEMAYYGISSPESSPASSGSRSPQPSPQASPYAAPHAASAAAPPEQARHAQQNPAVGHEERVGLPRHDAPVHAPHESRRISRGAGLNAPLPTYLPSAEHNISRSQDRGQPQHSTGAEESPRSKGNAMLVNLGDGTSHRLGLRLMSMGRDTNSDITLNDANASRNHAQLTQDAMGVWKIIDLGSTNGTLLNEAYIKQAFLNDGDIITIGLTSLEFRA